MARFNYERSSRRGVAATRAEDLLEEGSLAGLKLVIDEDAVKNETGSTFVVYDSNNNQFVLTRGSSNIEVEYDSILNAPAIGEPGVTKEGTEFESWAINIDSPQHVRLLESGGDLYVVGETSDTDFRDVRADTVAANEFVGDGSQLTNIDIARIVDGDGSTEINTDNDELVFTTSSTVRARFETGGQFTVLSDAVFEGSVEVLGNTTVVNTTDLEVADNVIVLNIQDPQPTNNTLDSGFRVQRGTDEDDIRLLYIEDGTPGADGRWAVDFIDDTDTTRDRANVALFGDNISSFNIDIDTDDIGEGNMNLYFTDGRVFSANQNQLVGGTNVSITEDAGNETFTFALDGELVDVSDNGTQVVSDVSDINFNTNVAVVDDGDGTVTINATDTTTSVSDSGTEVVNETTDIDFGIDLGVTDDGDGTVTVDHSDTGGASDVTSTAGVVLDSVSFDNRGHAESVGTIDADARYVEENGDTMTGDLFINAADDDAGLKVGDPDGGTSLDVANGLEFVVANDAEFGGEVTAQTLTETSTIELKENVRRLESQMNKFTQLEPVSFDWKDSGETDIGLIAEEVQEIYPELVSGDANGINYSKLTSVLISVVKSMNEELNEIKSKL